MLTISTHIKYILGQGPSKTKQSRTTIGEKEKQIVLECYNSCNGKNWKDVIDTAKQKIGENATTMPGHVVNLYLSQGNESLMRRMQNIVKRAMKEANEQSSVPAQSTEIGTEQQQLVSNVTKYSKKMSPNERRAEAVKRKLNQNYLDSSSSEDETTDTASKKPKRKVDAAKSANIAHAKMCEKAMSTMDNVNTLLQKVDKYLEKNN